MRQRQMELSGGEYLAQRVTAAAAPVLSALVLYHSFAALLALFVAGRRELRSQTHEPGSPALNPFSLRPRKGVPSALAAWSARHDDGEAQDRCSCCRSAGGGGFWGHVSAAVWAPWAAFLASIREVCNLPTDFRHKLLHC